MNKLVFDTSSLITLAMNSLLPTIKPLFVAFEGEFLIPPQVKKELVDNPLHNKKYSLEAMITLKSIELGYLKVDTQRIREDIQKIANAIFKSRKRYIQILHQAECDAIALAIKVDANALVIDERTTRLLIESPLQLQELLTNKLHTEITINQNNLKEFAKLTKGINILRSAELMAVAFEKGILDKYLPESIKEEEEVKALLWALRLNGCAISTEEIEKIASLTK